MSVLPRERLLQLAEAWNWRCWLCGELVDREPDPTGRNPRRASVDHVRPRSQGGTLYWHNLRLAHGECNSRRRQDHVAQEAAHA